MPCSHHLHICEPARIRDLFIINTRLTRLHAYAPLTPSISALRAFFLSCVVSIQVKGKIPTFYMCAPFNSSPYLFSLLSFILLLLLLLLLLTLYSNKLDLVFYISHKLIDYLDHLRIIKIKYLYIHIYKYKKTNIWIYKQS